MALKRVALEIGMGTDIRGGDYTKAAVRALRDALWHNSLTVATAVGKSSDDMQVEVLIGVPQPDKVDTAEVLKVLPHGTGTVKVFEGGLEITNEAGTDKTVIAQAAAIVRLDLKGDGNGPEARHPRARHRQRPARRRLHQGRPARRAGRPASFLARHAAGAEGQPQDRHVRRPSRSACSSPTRSTPRRCSASLPHGIVTVKVVKGGLDVADPENNDPAVIASAAVEVRLELP